MSKCSKCIIYSLMSSEDGRVRYIGQTTQSVQRRLAQHLADATSTRSDTRCHRWIRKSIRNGYDVTIDVVEENAEINTAEIKWIKHYRTLHDDLTNILNGGDLGAVGVKRSKVTCERMSKPKSETHKANMRKPKALEHKIKIAAAQIGNSKSQGESNSHAVLTANIVVAIRHMLQLGTPGSILADKFGVRKSAISKIKNRTTWKHI